MKRVELQNNLAMMMVLLMGAMLFATLFMGYAIYRTSSAQWPPAGHLKVSLVIPFVSTVIVLLSSWFCRQVRVHLLANRLRDARISLHLTLALGCGFIISQCFLWTHLQKVGIYMSSGIFGSLLYGFTWVHAAHMAAGLLSLIYLNFVVKSSDAPVIQKALNVEKFWHFLGIIWVIMFLTLFVL